jgi:hypothetical protein
VTLPIRQPGESALDVNGYSDGGGVGSCLIRVFLQCLVKGGIRASRSKRTVTVPSGPDGWIPSIGYRIGRHRCSTSMS